MADAQTQMRPAMPRYTRIEMAEDLLCELRSSSQHRAIQLSALLIPEVSRILKQELDAQGAERLRLEQEAWALQSEPNPPYEVR